MDCQKLIEKVKETNENLKYEIGNLEKEIDELKNENYINNEIYIDLRKTHEYINNQYIQLIQKRNQNN